MWRCAATPEGGSHQESKKSATFKPTTWKANVHYMRICRFEQDADAGTEWATPTVLCDAAVHLNADVDVDEAIAA